MMAFPAIYEITDYAWGSQKKLLSKSINNYFPYKPVLFNEQRNKGK